MRGMDRKAIDVASPAIPSYDHGSHHPLAVDRHDQGPRIVLDQGKNPSEGVLWSIGLFRRFLPEREDPLGVLRSSGPESQTIFSWVVDRWRLPRDRSMSILADSRFSRNGTARTGPAPHGRHGLPD